jgi:lysine-specific demethylase 8
MKLPDKDDQRLTRLYTELGGAGAHTVVRVFRRSCLHGAPSADSVRDALTLCDAAWEKLHTGDWRDVTDAWRDAYSLAALLLHACGYEGSLRALDLATLVGGDTFRTEVDDSLAALQNSPKRRRMDSSADVGDDGCWLLGLPPAAPVPLPPGAGVGGVQRARVPSLEAFLREALAPALPMHVSGMLEGWSALERWSDARYWLRIAGDVCDPSAAPRSRTPWH